MTINVFQNIFLFTLIVLFFGCSKKDEINENTNNKSEININGIIYSEIISNGEYINTKEGDSFIVRDLIFPKDTFGSSSKISVYYTVYPKELKNKLKMVVSNKYAPAPEGEVIINPYREKRSYTQEERNKYIPFIPFTMAYIIAISPTNDNAYVFVSQLNISGEYLKK